MSNLTPQSGLARRRLGTGSLVFFTVAASAPMTVLAGGVTTTYAVTGGLGVPLSFPILALALGLFAVGYAAMSRYVSNAGAFYAYLAQGLGRAWGVSASFVALIAYNTIAIGLYGLFGFAFGGFMSEKFQVDQKWWVWALGALALVGILGILRVDLNAKVLGFLLILEIIAVIIFDIGSFSHPADGNITAAGWQLSDLTTGGVAGGIFALGIAAFVGFESGAIYSEECKDPRRTVARATYIALLFTGTLYALSAWALLLGYGTSAVTVGAGDPAGLPEGAQFPAVVYNAIEAGPGAVFGLMGQHWATWVADAASILFITSVFAALLSFHNGVSRYLFALGRERVLFPGLGRTGVGSGAPVAGSLITSVIALIVVTTFAALGRDPLFELFTWFSYVAAVGVLLLMTGTSVAVIGFFAGRDTVENAWQRVIAPVLGTIVLGTITVITVLESDKILTNPVTAGSTPTARWILTAAVFVAAVLGLIWGLILRSAKPDIYQGIGRGAIEPMDNTGARSPAPSPVRV